MKSKTCQALVDCEVGRRLGCQTFCCRLVVRLTAEERMRGVPCVGPSMGCVPKDEDGSCVHLDRNTNLCRIWNERPQVCRDYDCNNDELLQVVLLQGFRTLTELVTSSLGQLAERRVVVPRRDEEA